MGSGSCKIIQPHALIREEEDEEDDNSSLKILSVTFSTDSGLIFAGTSAKTVLVWDVLRDELLCQLDAIASRTNSVSITPDGHWLLGVGTDKHLRRWDLKALRQRGVTEIAPSPSSLPIGNEADVLSVVCCRDGEWIVSGHGGKEKCMAIWKPASVRTVCKVFGHTKSGTYAVLAKFML